MTTHRWFLLIAALLQIKLSTATGSAVSSLLLEDSNDDPSINRQLKVQRTYRYYNEDLNCVVGIERTDDTLKFFPFEFWYAAESDTPDMGFMRKLEMKLFKAVSSHVFWCYGQYSSMNFNGRRLSDSEIAQRELEIRLLRKLGVVSVSSGGYDVATENECPFESRFKFCTVVKGKMTIMAHANDDVQYVIASIQDALENAMYTNVVLDTRTMPTLRNVKYLGDSSEDAFAGAGAAGGENNEDFTFVSSILPTSLPSDSPTGNPTFSPVPSSHPTSSPEPSSTPTESPAPTSAPTESTAPSNAPTTLAPSERPTCPHPSASPTNTTMPSESPSTSPEPSPQPTSGPSATPSVSPSSSGAPSTVPTSAPSASPTGHPTDLPTESPTVIPSDTPSQLPTDLDRNDLAGGGTVPVPNGGCANGPSDREDGHVEDGNGLVVIGGPTEMPTFLPTESPTGMPVQCPNDSGSGIVVDGNGKPSDGNENGSENGDGTDDEASESGTNGDTTTDREDGTGGEDDGNGIIIDGNGIPSDGGGSENGDSNNEGTDADSEEWVLVAHASELGGMFKYDTDLDPDTSVGTFVGNPTADTADFQRQFPFTPNSIKFVTGNGNYAAIYDWDQLKSIIDAREGDFNDNIDIGYSSDGEKTYVPKRGNVLSREGVPEDPWIDMAETHCGDGCKFMFWGEAGWGSEGIPHTALTAENGGMNVYISKTEAPAFCPGFGSHGNGSNGSGNGSDNGSHGDGSENGSIGDGSNENGVGDGSENGDSDDGDTDDDSEEWVLVGHASGADGMFKYDTDLDPDASVGTFDASPNADTADFQRPFPFTPNTIKFVTGNGNYSAIYDWDQLKSIIDAREGDFNDNVDLGFSDDSEQTYVPMRGNVLSREGVPEDPWIDVAESHCGDECKFMFWGEDGWGAEDDAHTTLTAENGGMNVYISKAEASAIIPGFGLIGNESSEEGSIVDDDGIGDVIGSDLDGVNGEDGQNGNGDDITDREDDSGGDGSDGNGSDGSGIIVDGNGKPSDGNGDGSGNGDSDDANTDEDSEEWVLVAHASEIGGMFKYDTDLDPVASVGTFVANPAADTADFQRPFPFTPNSIKFATGNGNFSAIYDWDQLKSTIDAREGDFNDNIDLGFSDDGEQTYVPMRGNVLSREGVPEDPWIDVAETHCGDNCKFMVWGEAGWGSEGAAHTALTTENEGMNVYISKAEASALVPGFGLIGDGSNGSGAGNGSDADGSGSGEGSTGNGPGSGEGTGNSEGIGMNATDGGDLNSTEWGNFTNATNATDEGGIIVLPPVAGAQKEIQPNEDESSSRTALAVAMPLIAALLIGLLLYKKQRRTLTASEYHEMMASDFVMVGTGDPPGSFHEGLYHYTKDGLRYLSTSCEACLETRRNTFYTDNGLPTILEDEVYGNEDEDDNSEFIGVISPDSKDLGTRHLGIDVHKCTSATCPKCNPKNDAQMCVFISSETNANRAILRNQDFSLTREEAMAYRSYGSGSDNSESEV